MSNIIIKTASQIEGVRAACRLTSSVFSYLQTVNAVVENRTTEYIDQLIELFIVSQGGEPALKGFKDYKYASCISVNDEVCHGVPGKRLLKNGDIVKVDTVVKLGGYYGDKAMTFLVGEVSISGINIARAAKAAMIRGIEAVRPKARIGQISHAVNTYAKNMGYTTVTQYAGHGVGLDIHEAPLIPFQGHSDDGDFLRPGMIFTVEPMLCQGSPLTKVGADGWTAKTVDGKLSAQYEETVLCTESGYEILT